MDDPAREEWSRHYDQVHWTEITVFTGVAVLLMSYAVDKAFNRWLFFMGLWVTNLTVYLTAGFREYRRDLAVAIKDDDTRKFLTNAARSRRLRGWPAFLCTFALLDVFWLQGFWKNTETWIAITLTSGSLGVLMVAGYVGRNPKDDDKA